MELSRGHVHGLLQQFRREQPQTLPLDLPAMAAPEETGQAEETLAASAATETALGGDSSGAAPVEDPLAVSVSGLAPGQMVASRYLGLTLFYPALQVVGLLELVAEVYQLAGAVRFGVQHVFTQLFCLALLHEPTVERVKRVLRGDLGAVMGCARAACVKTLRRKVDVLSQQRQAVRLGTLLARHWLEVGLLNTSYLYVDGHVKAYSGTRLVPEVWNSQRRMPLPGIVQYFVNDLHGRPLLVVSQEVRGNLAKSLPSVIAAVRQVVGDRRFTVIFDRGGFDGQLFKWLAEQGLDFITYQRGEVHLVDQQFVRREVRWEGHRVRFRVAEDAVSVGDSGPWRRIVLRTPDGHQTPILTSLDATVIVAARVAALMLARWRQENFLQVRACSPGARRADHLRCRDRSRPRGAEPSRQSGHGRAETAAKCGPETAGGIGPGTGPRHRPASRTRRATGGDRAATSRRTSGPADRAHGPAEADSACAASHARCADCPAPGDRGPDRADSSTPAEPASPCAVEQSGSAASDTPTGDQADRRCGQGRRLQCSVVACRPVSPPLPQPERSPRSIAFICAPLGHAHPST